MSKINTLVKQLLQTVLQKPKTFLISDSNKQSNNKFRPNRSCPVETRKCRQRRHGWLAAVPGPAALAVILTELGAVNIAVIVLIEQLF